MTLQQDRFFEGYTLFLDRDGVINERIVDGYVLKWDQFRFIPGVPEAMKGLAQLFRRIIIVTNQQGIGKGLMTEADLSRINQAMIKSVMAYGGRIDEVFHCPDTEGTPGNCRKPGPTLAVRARERFPEISFKRSIMIGDSSSDMQFAANLGMRSVFIDGGDQSLSPGSAGCDLRFESLYSFFLWINNDGIKNL